MTDHRDVLAHLAEMGQDVVTTVAPDAITEHEIFVVVKVRAGSDFHARAIVTEAMSLVVGNPALSGVEVL